MAPDKLRDTLQRKVDSTSVQANTIILGYGLCSCAVVGLQASNARLVIPKVDDCIALFLGSRSAYDEQWHQEPGTYYLTKGWIEVGDTPFEDIYHLAECYGQERAERMMRLMFGHYTRLVYIDTGVRDQDWHRNYARAAAERFGLRYEEISGSSALLAKMLHGPWDEDFVVKAPGETVAFTDFKTTMAATSGRMVLENNSCCPK